MTSRLTRTIAVLACAVAPAAFAQSAPNGNSTTNGSATNGDSRQVTVGATVLAKCKISSAPSRIDFPQIDPSVNQAVTSASQDVVFNCSNGVPFTTSIGGIAFSNKSSMVVGDLKMTAASTNGPLELPYSLTATLDHTTGQGFSSGKEIKLSLAGTLQAANFQDAIAGAYDHTLQLDIRP